MNSAAPLTLLDRRCWYQKHGWPREFLRVLDHREPVHVDALDGSEWYLSTATFLRDYHKLSAAECRAQDLPLREPLPSNEVDDPQALQELMAAVLPAQGAARRKEAARA